MAVRMTACPLCRTKYPKSYFGKSPLCTKCQELSAKHREQHTIRMAQKAQHNERRASSIYKKFEDNRQKFLEAQLEKEKRKKELTVQNQIDAATKEQASIALARSSLIHYIERFKPGYDASWAHEDVARKIERFVQDVADGKNPRLILQISSRFGKQVIDSTEVFTLNKGWTTHGELKVDDLVFGIDGKPTRVVAVSEPSYSDLELTFSDGSVVVAHENHEWLVRNNLQRRWEIRETKHLTHSWKTKKPIKLKFENHSAFSLPSSPPLVLPSKELIMEPYALGVHLGDGRTGQPVIAHHPGEMEIIDALVALGYERTYACHNFKAGSCQTRFGVSDKTGISRMRNELAVLGLSKTKFIPEEYFTASEQQRLELLAGLIDTDGTVCKTSGRVQISTCSERLRDDIVMLLRTLGQKPYYSAVAPALSSSGIQGKKTTYMVGFQPDRADIPTRLPRKKICRVVPKKRVGISSIKKVEPQKGRCIQVESPYGVYLIGRTFIPTHNSQLASDSGPAWILGNHPDWNIVISSYSDELPVAFSKSIRNQIRSEDYRKIFPHGAKIREDDAGAKAWTTEQGGGLRATGVGGGLLGFGAHILIVDDPIKDMEVADSPGALDKVYDWFSSVAYSRLMPGGGILVIQQRMAHEDLVGRLEARMHEELAKIQELRKEAAELMVSDDPRDVEEANNILDEANELDASMDKWDIATYPALATTDEYLDPISAEIIKLPQHVPPKEGWRLLRKKGEAIHPKRYGRNYYLKLKRANERRFMAMYQLTPQSDEGEYFSRSSFQRYTPNHHPKAEFTHTFCAWDLAIGTKQTNDHTVGIAGCYDHKGQLWLLERIRGRFGDITQIADMVIDLHVRWKASMTGIERTHLEMAMAPILANRMRERQQFIVLAEGKEALKPVTDKKVRARPFQNLCRKGAVFVPEGEDWDEYINLMTRFGATQVDDDVDASAWLAILATRQAPPRDPSTSRVQTGKILKPWYDELMEELGGPGGSYMEA